MNGKNWLARALQIREGEGRPIVLLMILSYFSGWALALYYITSTTVFLEYFETQMLPAAYACAGVASYLAWWGLSKMDKRMKLIAQLRIKTIIVLLSVLFFSVGIEVFPSSGMAFFMFVWFRVLAFISVVVFWGVAGRLFDLRQGKRIFGLISTGEVLSDIIGFFSIPILLRYIGHSELLFLASASLGACLLVLLFIIKDFRDKLDEDHNQIVTSKKKQKQKESKPFLTYLKDPYFRHIFILAMIPIFSIMFIDFIFLDQTKAGFKDPEVLASFLSVFFGAVAVIELLLKTFVSGRLISSFGLRTGLLALPVSLVVCTLLAVLSGTFYGPTLMFFSFIILMKLTDRSLRSAIFDPGFQILYQPLPAGERINFQNKIEGVPKAIGNTVAGLTLLLLTFLGLKNLVYYNLIFLVIAGIWVGYTLSLYREYRQIIRKVLMGKSGLEYTVRSFVKAGSVFFEDLINSPVRRKAINTLNLMEKLEPITKETYYRSLLEHPNARIRKEVLGRISFNHLTSMTLDIHNLLAKEEKPEVLAKAQEVKGELERLKNYRQSDLERLSRSEDHADRITAANIMGQSPRGKARELLVSLLQDDDPHVRTNALLAAGKIKSAELWPYLVDNLSVPIYSNAASTAIIEMGESILSEMDLLFAKMESNREAQYKIIRIIGRIGGKRAIWLLRNRINYPVDNIRQQVLLSLSNLGYKAMSSEHSAVKQAIEYDIGNIAWILASIQDLSSVDACSHLITALESESYEKMERIFLLLSLLYDPQAMKKVRDIMQRGSRNERVFALEIIDMLVEDSIRNQLIPLIDDNSIPEKMKMLQRDHPQERLKVEDRLKDIVNRDFITVNKWTRSCALRVIGELQATELEGLLMAHLMHPDFIVRECAQWSLQQINKQHLYDYAGRMNKESKEAFLDELREGVEAATDNDLAMVFDKVLFLKQQDLFAGFPELYLIDIAALSCYFETEKGEKLQNEDDADQMFKIVYGSVRSQNGSKKPKIFGEGELISEMDFGTTDWYALELETNEPSGLMCIPQEPMFEAIGNHVFLARFIATYIDNK